MWFQTFNICACGAMEAPHDQMNLDDGIKTTSMQKKMLWRNYGAQNGNSFTVK
jgi:hypothetical protein